MSVFCYDVSSSRIEWWKTLPTPRPTHGWPGKGKESTRLSGSVAVPSIRHRGATLEKHQDVIHNKHRERQNTEITQIKSCRLISIRSIKARMVRRRLEFGIGNMIEPVGLRVVTVGSELHPVWLRLQQVQHAQGHVQVGHFVALEA